MKTFSITITDHSKPARNLLDLATNGSGNGYTVAGGIQTLTVTGSVVYLSVQASNTNGNTTIVYTGDADTKNDGSQQGKELKPGDTDVFEAYPVTIYLGEIYIRASADGALVNVQTIVG